MLECGGCKTVFFQEEYMCSEDVGPDGLEKLVTYYPAPAKRKRPEWFSLLDLEAGLYRLLTETYNALDGCPRSIGYGHTNHFRPGI